ncbi:MAG TPA: M15 family metallopeptidase [Kofleriaceae bacterium]|nr:M15 family metallopeptidase [Kofleriaceae bacterium]
MRNPLIATAVAPSRRMPHACRSMRLAIALLVCLVPAVASANTITDPAPETRVATGYRNGKPVKVKLVEIDWALVELQTARAFLAMRAAAAEDGIDIVIWSGFRTNERQAELYRAYREGYGNPAAKPGYSNHQLGRALDLMLRGDVYPWLVANAPRFGFRATVKGEPWHWEFRGVPRRRS